jgi:hypothetical protein
MLADGTWNDLAEKNLAFDMYGAYMLKAVDPASEFSDPISGSVPSFIVDVSALSELRHRPELGQVGATMYFNADFMPVAVMPPSGKPCWKSTCAAKSWQYWKWVWRSSLFLQMTVVDHLYLAHLTAALSLAASIREALPPLHPLRRFLTMFSFNTISVNFDALTQLLGPRALLHRSTPFVDMNDVSLGAQKLLPSMKTRFGAFLDPAMRDAIPEPIRQAPYWQDAPLMFNAEYKMVSDWVDLYEDDWCESDGKVKDPAIVFWLDRLKTWSMQEEPQGNGDFEFLGLQPSENSSYYCEGIKKFLAIEMFAVTGWHRTVGWVTDLASDADFASFSWAEGEPYARPRQHLMMTLVAVATTGKRHPKLNQDYSFLAKGIKKEAQAVAIFHQFQSAMIEIEGIIKARNDVNRTVPFYQMLPSQVDSSVGV